MTNTAVSLLNAAERAKPTDRDTRLIDLALPLLRDEAPADLQGKPEAVVSDNRIGNLRLIGYAYHLRGDPKRAGRRDPRRNGGGPYSQVAPGC